MGSHFTGNVEAESCETHDFRVVADLVSRMVSMAGELCIRLGTWSSSANHDTMLTTDSS